MRFTMLGSDHHPGPVLLSDDYSSVVGNAKQGVAASQKALYDAYNSLNSRIKALWTGSTAPLSAGATFNLDLSNYNHVLIIGLSIPTTIIPVGRSVTIAYYGVPYFLDQVVVVSTTKVTFNGGYSYGTYTQWATANNPSYGTLWGIYGINL